MRAFVIAFAAVFVAGFGSALAFYEFGTAAGISAALASVLLILVMSLLGAAIIGPASEPLNLLMDAPHWKIHKAGGEHIDFSEFFRALAELSPPDSFSCASWRRLVR